MKSAAGGMNWSDCATIAVETRSNDTIFLCPISYSCLAENTAFPLVNKNEYGTGGNSIINFMEFQLVTCFCFASFSVLSKKKQAL